MRNKIYWTLAIAIPNALLIAPASARPPAEVADLEGVIAPTAEESMVGRGYQKKGSHKDGGQNWTYWYNKHALNKCIGVTVNGGRFDSIVGFEESKCHKSGDAAGAIIAGAAIAAIIGAATTSHHDKHYPTGYRPQNNDHGAEFERGYRDGLHDGPFVNYDHDQNYVNGFNAGQNERHNRLESNRHSYHDRKRGADTGRLRSACASEADRYWGLPYGSSHSGEARATGNGMYDVKVSAGYQYGVCTVTSGGDVKFIQNR